MYHKIAVTSDNHINILFEDNFAVDKLIAEQVRHLKSEHITHLIINGDISWDREQTEYYINHLTQALKGFCEVSYNMGNHDLSQNYNLVEYFNINDKRYLPNNEIVFSDSKQVIIGNDGFFDYNFIQSYLDVDTLDDLNRYTNSRYFKDEEDIHPKDVLGKLLEQAENKLKYYSKNGFDIIYITHYIPKQEFVLPNSSDKLIFKNAFMGSPLIGELLEKYNVKKCYFGHTHRRLGSNELNGITYICNPVGLPKNWVENGINDSDFLTEWKRTLEIISEGSSNTEVSYDLKSPSKFRGFSKETGNFIYGSLVNSDSNINNGEHFILPEFSAIEKDSFGYLVGYFKKVIPETIGQYTGFSIIYGGDIVSKGAEMYIVKWSNEYCGFRLKPINGGDSIPFLNNETENEYKVVGTIHDKNKLF